MTVSELCEDMLKADAVMPIHWSHVFKLLQAADAVVNAASFNEIAATRSRYESVKLEAMLS